MFSTSGFEYHFGLTPKFWSEPKSLEEPIADNDGDESDSESKAEATDQMDVDGTDEGGISY